MLKRLILNIKGQAVPESCTAKTKSIIQIISSRERDN